jgi:hypothetical protein
MSYNEYGYRHETGGDARRARRTARHRSREAHRMLRGTTLGRPVEITLDTGGVVSGKFLELFRFNKVTSLRLDHPEDQSDSSTPLSRIVAVRVL